MASKQSRLAPTRLADTRGNVEKASATVAIRARRVSSMVGQRARSNQGVHCSSDVGLPSSPSTTIFQAKVPTTSRNEVASMAVMTAIVICPSATTVMRNQAIKGKRTTFAPSIIQYGFSRLRSLSRRADFVVVLPRRSGSDSGEDGMLLVDMVTIKFIDQGRLSF